LKKRKAIEQLFQSGKSFSTYPFRIYYLLLPRVGSEEHLLQFGVAVSKRYFKKAVDRNRIKRQIREVYRVEKLPLKQRLETHQQIALKVFFIYTGKEMPLFNVVQQKVTAILQKLEKEIAI
jgi:ribonuclease P protein component